MHDELCGFIYRKFLLCFFHERNDLLVSRLELECTLEILQRKSVSPSTISGHSTAKMCFGIGWRKFDCDGAIVLSCLESFQTDGSYRTVCKDCCVGIVESNRSSVKPMCLLIFRSLEAFIALFFLADRQSTSLNSSH